MRFGQKLVALLFSFSLFGAAASDALAARALPDAPNQVNAPSWNKSEQRSAKAHGQWGQGYPFAESRLEAELQAQFTDGAAREAGVKILDGIAIKKDDHDAVAQGTAKPDAAYKARKARAAKEFGKGSELIRIKESGANGAWEVADLYVDDDNFTLYQTKAAIRIRNANGVAMLNFKPPTRLRFENGVAHGVENGFDVQGVTIRRDGDKMVVDLDDRALTFLTSKSRLNPLRELPSIYPDLFPRTGKGGRMTAADRKVWKASLQKLFTPRVAIQQDRVKYEILEHGVKMNEITNDKVVGKNAGNLAQPQEVDYRAEAEGDHVTLAMLQGLQANPQARGKRAAIMHPAVITHHPSITRFTKSGKPTIQGVGAPEIPQIHHVAEALQRIMPGLSPAGKSKYVGMVEQLGLLAGRSLTPVRMGRAAPQKPVEWRQPDGTLVPRLQDKAKAPARGPSRSAAAQRGAKSGR